MSATTGRAAIERLLASAAFNAYYRFRVGLIGDGTCTLEVPFLQEPRSRGDLIARNAITPPRPDARINRRERP